MDFIQKRDHLFEQTNQRFAGSQLFLLRDPSDFAPFAPALF